MGLFPDPLLFKFFKFFKSFKFFKFVSNRFPYEICHTPKGNLLEANLKDLKNLKNKGPGNRPSRTEKLGGAWRGCFLGLCFLSF